MAKETTGRQKTVDVGFVFQNTLFGFLATGVFLLLCAVAATYLAVPEAVSDLMVIAVAALAIFWCGFRAARHAGRQGLLRGALAGVLYMTILYLAGTLILGELAFTMATLLSLLMGIACGALGGMIGVNTKIRRKR